MSFTLKIATDNAAFDEADGPGSAASEICRILEEQVMAQLMRGQTSAMLFDVNGNRVGEWALELPEPDEDEEEDRACR